MTKRLLRCLSCFKALPPFKVSFKLIYVDLIDNDFIIFTKCFFIFFRKSKSVSFYGL